MFSYSCPTFLHIAVPYSISPLHEGTLVHCCWECRLLWTLWKTVWNYLKKLKMAVPFNTVIPLLGVEPKNPESPIQKNLCTPMSIAAQFTIATWWKQPKCPSVNEWVKKLWYILTMENYTTERKRNSYPSRQHGWNWRVLCKWNKPGSERQIPYDLTHKWNLISKTNKWAK